MSSAVIRHSSWVIGVVIPGRHVGNASIVPSRTNSCASSRSYAFISGELGLNRPFVCIVVILGLTPHPNGKVSVLPFALSWHGDFENARRAIADMAKEQVSVVIHGSARYIIRNAGGMLKLSHFLPLQRLRIEAPDYPLQLRAGPRHGFIFGIAPTRRNVIKFSAGGNRQPAAVIREHISRKRQVARLRRRSKVLDSRPITVIEPD